MPRRLLTVSTRRFEDGTHLILQKVDQAVELDDQHDQGNPDDERFERDHDDEDVADPVGGRGRLKQAQMGQSAGGSATTAPGDDARTMDASCCSPCSICSGVRGAGSGFEGGVVIIKL